jgi:hypothetical protein
MRTTLVLFALGLGCSSTEPAVTTADTGSEVAVDPVCHPELKAGDPCTEGFSAICYCNSSPDRGVTALTLICCYEGHIERSYPCYDPGGPPSCRMPADTGVPEDADTGADAESDSNVDGASDASDDGG